MNRVLFKSDSQEWETPQEFFDQWDVVFHFQLDVCASEQNAKCKAFFSREQDGLKMMWAPYTSIWMNPPYGREIGKWMRKAYEESCMGCLVVCLVPARTDVRWWHDYAMRGIIHFVNGRIKFGGYPKCAPFPSAVVVFMGNLLERRMNCAR